MKNKLFIIALALILLLAVAGCSAEEAAENPNETDSSQETEQVAQEEGTNVEAEPEEPAAKEAMLDSSLDGIDLLKSISGDRPKTMKIKSDMESNGMITSSTIYYDGDNTRTETVTEGLGTSVLIYNAAEEVMYSYVEGAENGVRMNNVDMESAEESGLTMDMSTEFSGISDAIADDVIARVEKLGEEEVVYIETTEEDEEMGDILVKMWYSTKYNMPLKYEIFMGQTPIVSLNVTEIEKDIKIDKQMFTIPTDISFQDVDIETLMGE